MSMRIKWDPKKNQILKHNPKRLTSFEEAKILIENIEQQIGGELKSSDPEQYYVSGWVAGKLITLVYGHREDNEGEYVHLVTLWKTTKQERKRFSI